MTLAIEVRRGPLAPDDLDVVGRTYGTVDRRYAARAFCEAVFNRNPFGYAWHAFVRDGDRAVGHYAVIPMRARAGDVRFTLGKGEALFLEEACRTRDAALGGSTVPAGLALMKALHDHALRDGADVLANVTSAEIGMMQRMDGFRAVRVERPQIHYLVSPGRLRRLRGSAARAWGARGLAGLQRIALVAARLALARGPRAVVHSEADDAEPLAAFSRADPAPRGWSVARDLETLRWLRGLGRLEVVSVAGRPAHFAVANTGNAREVLHWTVPAADAGGALAVLAALARSAIRDRAWILSAPAAADDAGLALRRAGRMLCFRRRGVELTVYVKSARADLPGRAPLVFTRMFNL